MNYRRGTQRVYAVIVVLWLLLLTMTFFQKQMWSGTVEDIVLIGFLVIPPVIGYAILFMVIPWLYRGFKSDG
jgi:hypothetical protein